MLYFYEPGRRPTTRSRIDRNLINTDNDPVIVGLMLGDGHADRNRRANANLTNIMLM